MQAIIGYLDDVEMSDPNGFPGHALYGKYSMSLISQNEYGARYFQSKTLEGRAKIAEALEDIVKAMKINSVSIYEGAIKPGEAKYDRMTIKIEGTLQREVEGKFEILVWGKPGEKILNLPGILA